MSKQKKPQSLEALQMEHQRDNATADRSSAKPAPTEGPNIGWLYNRHYFMGFTTAKDHNKSLVRQRNQDLTEKPLPITDVLPFSELPVKAPVFAFDLKTTYPGLVTGIGMKHETGKAEGEFKLGCAFDHTTGLPYIAGSGVKGKLRSFFKYPDYLLYVIREILPDRLSLGCTAAMDELRLLEINIFDGKTAEKTPLGPYKTDIFHDAFALKTDHEEKQFLADDSITPHPHPLKSPVPIQFLKVGPGVTFQFVFRLFDAHLPNQSVFRAADKCALFGYLLKEHGIGAKTNVGYGQFQ